MNTAPTGKDRATAIIAMYRSCLSIASIAVTFAEVVVTVVAAAATVDQENVDINPACELLEVPKPPRENGRGKHR